MALVTVLAVVLGGVGVWTFSRNSKPATPAQAAGTPRAAVVVVPVPTVLILDGSGSMTTPDAPGPRIDAAKMAARGLLDALPDTATIALETYGTATSSADADKPAGCRDVTSLIPMGPINRGTLGSAVDAITPSGYTPISLALRTAAGQLPTDGKAQAIVLMSDGEDTCDTPPCDTAAQLKKTHPALAISTVGFKVDGPAAEQLRCIANATGGLSVQAANAAQLAARLLATQNLDQANSSMNSTGLGDINLGDKVVDIKAKHSDFPDVGSAGSVTVTWRDCDFEFLDAVLNSIQPRNGGRTIDGITAGSPVAKATELYGKPLSTKLDGSAGSTSVLFSADENTDAAYDMSVEGYTDANATVSGTIKSIILCRCKPHAAAPPVDAAPFKASIEGGSGYFFASPDGVWRCAIRTFESSRQPDAAGCDAGPDPASTDQGWPRNLPIAGVPKVRDYENYLVPPNIITVDNQSARFSSFGIRAFENLGRVPRTLGYGQTISAMGFSCNSRRTGISCRSDATSKGFTISSDGYSFEYTPVGG